MYNNSRLAFFRLVNENTNKVNDTIKNEEHQGTLISSLNLNINSKYKKLLDNYNDAVKNVEVSKQLLDNFKKEHQYVDETQPLVFVTEQAAGKYQNTMNNMMNIPSNDLIEKTIPILIYCDWNEIKSNPTNIENIRSLTNVDEMIYPYLDKLVNLKSISFLDGFNVTINLSKMNALEDIIFGSNFNQILSKDNLPVNLKKLKLGLNFIRKIDSLPDSIEELKLDDRYNSMIILPSNLLSLTIGDSFNQDIELNNKLEYVSFGYHYNKSLTLPESLKKLLLPGKFNQDIELNEGIEELTLGSQFNRNLKLPNSMKIITLKNKNILSKITLNKNVKINM
jgi:hypothetical protein